MKKHSDFAARSLADFISAELGTTRWYVEGGSTVALAPGYAAISPDTRAALSREHLRRMVPLEPERAEVRRVFQDLVSWKAWFEANPWVAGAEYEKRLTDEIEAAGFDDPFLGRAEPGAFTVKRANVRESIVFRGIKSRTRAILALLAEEHLPRGARVYASESVTPLARVLAKAFPGFVGSEYLPTPAERARYPGTRHEDVQALSFADGSMDVYVSCEVMEHIPFLPAAVAEAARILAPGGLFIATFPFLTFSDRTVTKATLAADGTVSVIGEPEYHGNPVDPTGSLVFSIPGWDILDLARSKGFARAEMVAISSRVHGIVSPGGPIFVLRAVR